MHKRNSQKALSEAAFKRRMMIFVCVDIILLASVGVFLLFSLRKSDELSKKSVNGSQVSSAEKLNDELSKKETIALAPEATDTFKETPGGETIDEDRETIDIETAQKLNDTFRANIEERFGIKIYYRDEVSFNAFATIANDEVKIRTALTLLEKELMKYPQNFFREGDVGLEIAFADILENKNISGATILGEEKIRIEYSIGYGFTGAVINHEIMHWIDMQIEKKSGSEAFYASYQRYNPMNFAYGEINENFIYSSSNPESYFVSRYSQSDVKEDRAELFSQMMTRSSASAMFSNGNLRGKASVINRQIKLYFPSAASTKCTWEQALS